MKPSTKPKACKNCRSAFTPSRPMQVVCGPMCGIERARKKREAEEKKAKTIEAKQDRAKKEALKTIPQLRAEAQVEFNRYIRARDAGQPCISCGKPPGDLSGLHAGRDAGHYRSTGAASHLRFDERNCHAQCVHCNQHLAGNVVAYRLGLIERIGVASVEALEAENAPVKWDRDTLRQIKVIYRAKTRALKREQS